jgi:hypothetical protein
MWGELKDAVEGEILVDEKKAVSTKSAWQYT